MFVLSLKLRSIILKGCLYKRDRLTAKAVLSLLGLRSGNFSVAGVVRRNDHQRRGL